MDATGKSYYGSTGLYLMHADGQFDCAVAPAKEGTVQDVRWGPAGSKGNKFVVIAGTMPSVSTLYNIKVLLYLFWTWIGEGYCQERYFCTFFGRNSFWQMIGERYC